MKRYLVSFTTNTPICIRSLPSLEDTKEPRIFSTALHFPNEEIAIQIYDNVVQYKSFAGRNGLRIDVALDSPDIISSVDTAGGYADAMLSFLVLCTSSYAPVVRFDFAYEIAPGIDKHEYMRDFYIIEDIHSLVQKKARPNIYGEIFNAVAALADRMQRLTTKRERDKYAGLQSAVRWFRKGIGTNNYEDEYICYWIALEALDDLLPQDASEFPRRKCAKCGYAFDTCPNCGKDPEIFATTSPLYGIERLARDAGLSTEEFRKLRRLRGKILHSGATSRTIKEKVPIVRNLLIDGLGRVLKLSKGAVQQIKEHEPLKASQTMRLRLKTYIEDVTSTLIPAMGYPAHPSIEVISHELKKVELSANGRLIDSTGSVTCQLVNCRIAENTDIKAEIWGNVPTVTRVSNLSIRVQKHDK